METIWITGRKASFTVEAVFVMSITVWVLAGICYLSLYSHDQTAMYSLVQNQLEMSVENGRECSETDIQNGLREYLQKHSMICRIDQVSVKKNMLSVQVDVRFHPEITLPFVRQLLSAEGGRTISCSHEVLFAPYYLWDSENIKDTLK